MVGWLTLCRFVNGIFTDGLSYYFLRIENNTLMCSDAVCLEHPPNSGFESSVERIFSLVQHLLTGNSVFETAVTATTIANVEPGILPPHLPPPSPTLFLPYFL